MTGDPNGPEVVAGLLSEPEAMALIDYLRERGFDARPWGTHVPALYVTFMPGQSAQIVVPRSEAEQARQTVDDFRRK